MADPITSHVLQQQLDPNAPGGQTQLSRWQLSPELPSSEELMATVPPPLPSVDAASEGPANKSDYLELQYRLQRYEGTELLRQAVNAYRAAPSSRDGDTTYIYTQVHVKGYLLAKLGAACRVSFSTERSPTRINWRQSKRLTAGTLVALSSDNFKTQCFVAVIAARYLLGGLEPDPRAGEGEDTPPRVELFWGDLEEAQLDPTAEFTMLEAKGGYYETVRHAMVGLQHAAFFESKFDKYFVEGHRKSPTADYLQAAVVPPSAATFDHSQMEAFKRMTSRELAIVQGPPGTGKTFTSVVAIESYVRTLQASRGKDEPPLPVVISAQTNHALDQLLEKCFYHDMRIVRLGGRSTVDCINERTMFNLRRNSKASRGDTKGDAARKSILQKAKELLTMCFPGGIISAEHFHRQGLLTQEQFSSLEEDDWDCIDVASSEDSFGGSMAKWLDGCIEEDRTYVYRPPHNQDEPLDEGSDHGAEPQEDDDEKERLQGEFLSAEFYWTGTMPSHLQEVWCFQAQRLLSRCSDLYKIKPPQRGMVYRYLRKSLVDKASREFPKLLVEHRKICDSLKISRWQNNVKVLQYEGIQVLGCTTTGLTKYRGLISALKPRVMMIEEAAETREANITSALYPSLDQIVLVGDHQQLVPHVDVHILGRTPYNLHISLFERLVQMGLPYSMLCVQRRMIPTLRKVVHAFYPKLEDHESVKDPVNRPPIPGMGGQNLWWFQHQWGEQHDANTFAYSNEKEANMIVGFVRYLVQNGMRPSQITVLTYYRGQVDLITSLLRKNPILSNLNPTKQWDVRTVDGFQGEENEIILLSLVRSRQNPYDTARVGFVDNENRAVVATSRARRGMYIFANSSHLLDNAKSRETWGKVYNIFVEQQSLGYRLPVKCEKHDKVTDIKADEDWEKMPWGGCDKPCDKSCPNGHPCPLTCHLHDQSGIRCKQACKKALQCGHICKSLCGQACECPHGCDRPALRSVEPQRPKLIPVQSLQGKASPRSRGRSQLSLPIHHAQQAQREPHPPSGDQGAWSGTGRGNQRGGKNNKGRGKNSSGNPLPRPKTGKPEVPQPSPVTDSSIPSQPAIPKRGEITSEDLLSDGYHVHLAKQQESMRIRGGRLPRRAATSTASDILVDMTDAAESISSFGESLSDKWSAASFRANEEALEKSLKEEEMQSPSRSATKIEETFRQVTSNERGTRIISRVCQTEYTMPVHGKASSEPCTQPIIELISDEIPPLSRKQLLLDAGAGHQEGDMVPPLGLKSEPTMAMGGQLGSQPKADHTGPEVDLLTF